MIRPWFRQAAVPWKTTVTQTRASGENRVSTKPGVLQSARTREIPGSLPEGGRQGLVALLDHGVPVRVGERVQVAALDGADRRPARFLRADPPVERVVLPRDVDIFEPAAGQVGRPVA